MIRPLLLCLAGLVILAGCSGGLRLPALPFDFQRVMGRVAPALEQNHVIPGDPVFIRIFKEENILELWMRPQDSTRYTLVKTYPICRWSGRLGPKLAEGDHQAPEGFYETRQSDLNPNSRYHVSFNIGFPNRYDRMLGRTGSFIMIHGDCVSEGCYAMTDPAMEEIYTLVERALANGQRAVPVHVFPFRMESGRMVQEVGNPWLDFWMNLREGYMFFEEKKIPPLWTVEGGRYVFY